MKSMFIGLLLWWCVGCSVMTPNNTSQQIFPVQADIGQVLDTITTGIALNQSGFYEANILFSGLEWYWMGAIKLGVTQVVKLTPDSFCIPGLMGLTVAGYGAAIWNIGVMSGCGLVTLPIIALVTWIFWDTWWADATQTCQGIILPNTFLVIPTIEE